MVAELDITDQDVTKIAEMIDGEIASLVPEWKTGFGLEESHTFKNSHLCQSCGSDGSDSGNLSPHRPAKNLQVLECSKHGCGSVHGRFEEITYQVKGSEQCVTDDAPADSSHSDGSHISGDNHYGYEHETSDQLAKNKDERIVRNDEGESSSNAQDSSTSNPSARTEDYENDIRQELRWLKSKYKTQLRKLNDQQLVKSSSFDWDNKNVAKVDKDEFELKSWNSTNNQMVYNYESAYNSCSPVHLVTAKSFYGGGLLPHSLHRATSLPVDATDF